MTHRTCSSSCYRGLIALGNFLQPFVLLALRLFWGYLFVMAGSQKLANPAQTVQLFQAHGLPLPLFFSYFVGLVEMIGGGLLIVGFGSRLAAFLLIIVTVVAFFMVSAPAAIQHLHADPEAVVKTPPFNFFLAALVVFAFGPGAISLDALFKRFCCRTSCTTTCDIDKTTDKTTVE